CERPYDRLEDGAFLRVDSGEEGFLEVKGCPFVSGDLAHVFEVLPMHAAPGDAFIDLFHYDFAQFGLDFRADKTVLIKAGAGLNFRFPISDFRIGIGPAKTGKEVGPPDVTLAQLIAREQVATEDQEA